MTTLRTHLLILVAGLAGCGQSAPPPSTRAPEDGVTHGDEARDHGTTEHRTHDEIPSLFRCEVPSDCTLTHQTCCGSCGAALRGDAMAVNAARAPYEMVRPECDEPLAGCPACDADDDPGLAASCIGHRCELVDLSAHVVSACTVDADCIARRRGCCGCEGEPMAMSSSAESEFRMLFCAPDERCLETCEGLPEGWPAASCIEGHCRLPLELMLREH